jgi:hypothetical protein
LKIVFSGPSWAAAIVSTDRQHLSLMALATEGMKTGVLMGFLHVELVHVGCHFVSLNLLTIV